MTAETADTQLVEPTELEEIAQIVSSRIVVDGIECEVGRLKTREFFVLMRILTRGLGGRLADLFDADARPEDNAGRFIGALLVSIPEAETDFILLVKRMVQAVDPDQADALRVALDNPGLETLLAIAETVAMQEAGELTRLGKAATSWWETNKEQLRRQA